MDLPFFLPVCGCGDDDCDTSLTRTYEQEIQVRITDPQCLSSMKHFLCTMYRRRCYEFTDVEAGSNTYGNQVSETGGADEGRCCQKQRGNREKYC
jgi:hypothetical protein